jgi:hypothetical protein
MRTIRESMIYFRNFLPALLFLLLISHLHAQEPAYKWAQSINTGTDASAVAVDDAGNSFVLGSYNNVSTIGSTILPQGHLGDLYIAKYDESGNVLWANPLGGAGTDYPSDVTTDKIGNCYVAGSLSVGYVWPSGFSYTDAFIAKYDAKGERKWLKTFGGKWDDGASVVKVDRLGNIYAAGSFMDTASFGNQRQLVSRGLGDIFIAKFDSNGTCLWAVQAGGAEADGVSGFSLDALGNFYVTGMCTGTAVFDSIIVTGSARQNIFIAKYDSNANVIWVRQPKGEPTASTGGDYPGRVAIDAAGNCIISGTLRIPTTFGQFRLGTTAAYGIFLAKYDPQGTCLWATSAEGEDQWDQGNDFAIDKQGNSFVVGSFAGLISFGNKRFLSWNSSRDGFIGKYDPNGICLWVKQFGAGSLEYANSIATDGKGSLWIAGYHWDKVAFDQVSITASGGFVVRMSDGVSPIIDEPPLRDTLGSYYSLEMGNTWYFQESGRSGGSGFGAPYRNVTASVTKQSTIDGKIYSVIEYTGLDNSTIDPNAPLWSVPILARYDTVTGNYYEYDTKAATEVLVDSSKCSRSGTYSWGTLTLMDAERVLGKITTLRRVMRGYNIDTRAMGLGLINSERTGFRGGAKLDLVRAIIGANEIGTGIAMGPTAGTIPHGYALEQNYPNPFNPSTTISFSLPSRSFVRLKIFDLMGREVAALVSEEMSAGNYSKEWNASGIPSGVYFYRLQAGRYTETKRLVLMR